MSDIDKIMLKMTIKISDQFLKIAKKAKNPELIAQVKEIRHQLKDYTKKTTQNTKH